jgi:hypothetical protein
MCQQGFQVLHGRFIPEKVQGLDACHDNSGTKQVTLLELYTSQGCSSCPPAERWLNEYIDDDDLWTTVVPAAFHVDYWDYIGWKDTYATPEYGERQRDYARAGKARTVYTPGLFANGREWRGWTLRVSPRASDREPGNLSIVISDGRLEAGFPAKTTLLELHVALLGFGLETQVERGEKNVTGRWGRNLWCWRMRPMPRRQAAGRSRYRRAHTGMPVATLLPSGSVSRAIRPRYRRQAGGCHSSLERGRICGVIAGMWDLTQNSDACPDS